MNDTDGKTQKKQSWWQDTQISGIQLPVYIGMFMLLLMVLWADILPKTLVGSLFSLWLVGNLLFYLGSHLPIVKTYLGGGAVFCLFIAALLTTFGIAPHSLVESGHTFIETIGFMDLFIISLITSAILAMDRKMLLKATVRFMPVALLSTLTAFLAVGLMGMALGNGFTNSVLYVAFPMMVGGIGAGMMPLSQIYGTAFHDSAAQQLSQVFPAGMFGNLLAILAAVVLVRVFKNSKINGHGKLIPEEAETEAPVKKPVIDVSNVKILGVGMVTALSFFMFGRLLNYFIPGVSMYAFIILSVIIVKALGIMPEYYEQATIAFGNVITKNMTSTMLAAVGLSMLNLQVLASALTPTFIILCLTSVIVIALTAGFLGKLFGLYPLEAAVTAGLPNDSMGGAGNIAVLAAADRLDLIAFAQMGNRIGGALMLVFAGIYVSFFS